MQQKEQKAAEQPFQLPPPRDRWQWTGFRKKTLWDWLQLLVVPFMLALVAAFFAASQENLQQQAEERRAEVQLEAEEQRAQDAALQAYLEEMGNLLLDEDLPTAERNDDVVTLAQARTLTILGRVDAARKRSVLRFLYEAGVIYSYDPIERTSELPILSLKGADLQGADLHDEDLIWSGMYGADLRNADLRRTILRNSSLSDTDLRDADLSDADLHGAHLSDANLGGANLRGADLGEADLEGATNITDRQLEQQAALLEGAIMPDGSKHD